MRSTVRRVASLLVVGALGFAAGATLAPDTFSFTGILDSCGLQVAGGGGRAAVAEPRVAAARAALGHDEEETIRLFDQASQSVVFIAISRLKNEVMLPGSRRTMLISNERLADLREEWLSGPRQLTLPGEALDDPPIVADAEDLADSFAWDSGSGIVWDTQGHIVTNYHVVQGHFDLMVRLYDRSDRPARVVGVDEDKDLAVLEIDAPPELLKPVTIGRSNDLRVGQTAYSIGNPFGLSSTLTHGIVSAVGRTIRSGTGVGRMIQDVIQTDCAINPGNSGGPLLDSSGHLIGVTTAIVSESGASAGIGFAVPVDTVNRIVPDLINFGYTARAGLGVQVQTELNNRIDGVMVAYVLPDSAAEAAGLQGGLDPETMRFEHDGDVIVSIDEAEIHNFDDLYRALDAHQPGDVIELTYVREKQARTAKIELRVLAPLQREIEPNHRG